MSMSYGNFVKETGVKLPHFAMQWLIMVTKAKDEKVIDSMMLDDIFKHDKAGHQALCELSMQLKDTPHSLEIKEFFKSMYAKYPVLKKMHHEKAD